EMQKSSPRKFHFEPPSLASLFNYLVGASEQRGRNFKDDRAGGWQVDDQFKLGRLHDRKVARLGTLEDFADVDADLAVRFRLARSVAHQAAGFRILAYIIDGGERMARRQRGKLEPTGQQERVRADQERVGSVVDKGREGSFDLATVARRNDMELKPDCGGRSRRIPRHRLSKGRVRIDKKTNARGGGNKLVQQSQLF